MMNDDDREFEERLRALTTGGPPGELRERILHAARLRNRRRRWTRPLAYALVLLGLVALDMGAEGVHQMRLARLTGDGQVVASEVSSQTMLAALRERRAMLATLDRREL